MNAARVNVIYLLTGGQKLWMKLRGSMKKRPGMARNGKGRNQFPWKRSDFPWSESMKKKRSEGERDGPRGLNELKGLNGLNALRERVTFQKLNPDTQEAMTVVTDKRDPLRNKQGPRDPSPVRS